MLKYLNKTTAQVNNNISSMEGGEKTGIYA